MLLLFGTGLLYSNFSIELLFQHHKHLYRRKMERDENTRTRRSFSLVSQNDTSNKLPEDNFVISSNNSLKRIRVDESEQHHNRSDGNGAFRGHFHQEQGVCVPHQGKDQSLWNGMLFDGEQRSGFNKTCIINKRECGHISCPDLVRPSDMGNAGELGERSFMPLSTGNCFDFLQTNTNGSCSSSSMPSLSWHNSAVLMSPRTGADSIMQASHSEAQKHTSNLLSPLEQTSERNRGKASVLDDHYIEPNRYESVHMGNMSKNALNSVSDGIPILSSQIEIKEQRLLCHGGNLVTQSEDTIPDEREYDRKRKLSATGFVDLSLLEDSQSTGWSIRESMGDDIGLSGQIRPHSQPLVNHSIPNNSMIQIWDDFSDNRTSLSHSNLSIERMNNSNDIASTSGVNPDGSATNLHNLYSRDPSYMEHRIANSGANGINGQCHETSLTFSNVTTCGMVNHYDRQDVGNPTFLVRESSPSLNDGTRADGVPNRLSSSVRRPLLDNSFGAQIPNGSPVRMINALESRAHGNQFRERGGTHRPVLPQIQNSAAIHGTGTLTSSPAPMSSNCPALVGSTRFPRMSSGQLPANHAASFADGRREGIVPRARIQNIFGLPFSSLRMPPGDRRRLISEVF